MSQIFSIAFDVLSCIVLAIPMLLQAFYKLFYFPKKDLSGKIVLVTGGARGIGQKICLELVKHRCTVVIADINLSAAEETVDEINRAGGKAKAYKLDVMKSDEIIKLRDAVHNDLGPVDILINNAGLMSNKSMDEKPEFIEKMVSVNVTGTILMSKFFLDQMKENQSGHIVSISSMSALSATPFAIPYGATKFAINGFMLGLTEHLRLTNWRSKIKTTCVFPYYVTTRDDVIDFLNPNIRFPPLDPEIVAREVVEGIRREDHNLTVPANQKPMVKFLGILPLSVQELVRDRILREYSWTNPDCKLNFDF